MVSIARGATTISRRQSKINRRREEIATDDGNNERPTHGGEKSTAAPEWRLIYPEDPIEPVANEVIVAH